MGCGGAKVGRGWGKGFTGCGRKSKTIRLVMFDPYP